MDTSAAASLDVQHSTRFGAIALAVLRVGIAVLWIQNASWKVPPDFGRDAGKGLFFWVSQAIEYPVLPIYSGFLETVILPNLAVFGYLTLLTEAALGAFLLIGLATRFWAIVGIAQTLAITLSVLNAPHEWHWSYYLMLLAHVALLGLAAGRSYGLDGIFRPIWRQSTGRFASILMRAS